MTSLLPPVVTEHLAEQAPTSRDIPLFVYLLADEVGLPAERGLPEGVRFISAGLVPAAMVSDSLALLEQAAAMWRGATGARLAGGETLALTRADTQIAYAWPIAPAHVVACPVTMTRELEARDGGQGGASQAGAIGASERATHGVIHIGINVTDTSRLISALAQASGLPAETFVVHRLPNVGSSADAHPDSTFDSQAQEASAADGAPFATRAKSAHDIPDRPGNIAAAVAALMCLLTTDRSITVQGWIFNADQQADADARRGVGTEGPHAIMQMSARLDKQGHIDTLQGLVSRRSDATNAGAASSATSAFDSHANSNADPQAASDSASLSAHPVYRIAQTRMEARDPYELIPSAAKTFARESFLDELSEQQGRDPIAFRLAHLDALHDAGARELIGTLADRAAWQGHRHPEDRNVSGGNRFPPGDASQSKPPKTFAQGRGFAFDTVGTPAAYSAWIVDIEVNRRSGEIDVRRVVAGQASGQPGARIGGLPADQIAASVAALIAPLSSTPALPGLNAQASADDSVDAEGRALSYDLRTRSIAKQRSDLAVRGEGTDAAAGLNGADSAAMPSADFMAPAAAAIANALFDATGIRFRAPPFTPERVREALAAQSLRGRRDIRADVAPKAEGEGVASIDQTVGGEINRSDVEDGLARSGSYSGSRGQQAKRRKASARSWLAMAGLGGVVGLAVSLWPARAPIEKIALPDLSTYSAETIERGRLVANTGDCAVCHTAAGGVVNAGGLGLDTPFGKVYSTNLTPDVDTGIGGWSYDAFARAMRQGISRDGRHLYPAFPYTAFAKISEADMTALYAYLMSQPAVSSTPPVTKLPFPFNQRGLMAGWNALYLKQGAYVPDTKQSAEWNRGAYLVEGLGHCSACHSPRNALGAERNGPAYMSGGTVDGWIAPSLTTGSRAPVQWTQAALYQYLSTGFSPEHGVAAGPMAPVVSGLSTLPVSDIHAIANYIASLNPVKPAASKQEGRDGVPATTALASVDTGESHELQHAQSGSNGSGLQMTPLVPASSQPLTESPARAAALDGDALKQGLDSGKRIFDAACAVCHAATGGVGNFGVRPLLSLNTSVSESAPDNLLRIIQDGIDAPATDALGYMPGFKDSLDDQQIADLTHYIRARFAPGQAAWTDVAARSAAVRNGAH